LILILKIHIFIKGYILKNLETVKILIYFILTFFPLVIYSQSDSLEKGFSINLQIGYLFPQKDDGPGGIKSGLAIKPSIQLKTSKNLCLYTEFSYSRLKYESRYGNNPFYMDYMLLNIGLKIYPKSKEKIYVKSGLGFAYSPGEESSTKGYSVNIGIGNDFKINNKINLFVEGELSLHKLLIISYWYSLYDFILSTGIKYKL
jgi:hypothetical protein